MLACTDKKHSGLEKKPISSPVLTHSVLSSKGVVDVVAFTSFSSSPSVCYREENTKCQDPGGEFSFFCICMCVSLEYGETKTFYNIEYFCGKTGCCVVLPCGRI